MVGDRFRTVIAQPATLCNLDCGYCYLPDRKRQTLMPVKVAQRLAVSIAEQGSESAVELVWHGGEPLTTPVAHMRALLTELEPLRCDGRLAHGVQTNATLISQPWIELFTEYRFRVGVSIDGPQPMNATRVDWAGQSSFANTMTGIERLRSAGIEFSVICVVTAATIGRADELLDFFADLGCASVGFNIEEQEGLNAHRQQVTPKQAQEFWAALWARRGQFPHLRIRDLDRLRGWLGHTRSAGAQPPGVYDPIPTVAATGQVVVLSPELLGVTAPQYADFVIGNVLTETLPQMMARLHQVGYVAEFDDGLRRCAAECDFWAFCGGAQAGNRFFEHGRFDTTETNYCRTTYQSVVRSALDHTRKGST
ncbi:cyclophane-forming radical SAM peptide maturase AmcB [Hamadaea sp. NPDC051192]|uniref:cyclophane-forming radical SAM peptide maturase AmcB n=1 Tax=Hamadaea sp. NPDC051192 TaxID=3154940 RepID=UPI0034384527